MDTFFEILANPFFDILIILVVFGFIFVHGRIMHKKMYNKLDNLFQKGESLIQQRQYESAFKIYKEALAVCLGLKGNTEWIASSIVKSMNSKGFSILNRINELYHLGTIPNKVDIATWQSLVKDVDAFAKNPDLVDKLGLPNKAMGKQIWNGIKKQIGEEFDRI